MTDDSGRPLGFCEFCGAKRIKARQGYCASCGQKLSQRSEVADSSVPVVQPLAPPAPAGPAEPASAAPGPVASMILEQPMAPAGAVAPAAAETPPASPTTPIAPPPWATTSPGDAVATPPSVYPPPPPSAAAYVPPADLGQLPISAQPQDYQQPGPGATFYQQAAPQPQAAAASSRRPKLLIMLALGAVVVLVAAGAVIFVGGQHGSIPAGTVQGRLVDSSGVAAAGKTLQLLRVTGQSGGTADTVTTDHKVTTDKNGRFAFDKVEASKYMIMDLNISMSLNDLLNGTGPSLDTMLVRGPGGTALSIDVPASQGLDLGDVTMPAS